MRDIQLGALRHNIGVVFQEALLFNRSIAENLRVGKPDATDEQMRDGREPARRRSILSNTMSRALTPKLASADARYQVASASGCPSRARCSKIRRS